MTIPLGDVRGGGELRAGGGPRTAQLRAALDLLWIRRGFGPSKEPQEDLTMEKKIYDYVPDFVVRALRAEEHRVLRRTRKAPRVEMIPGRLAQAGQVRGIAKRLDGLYFATYRVEKSVSVSREETHKLTHVVTEEPCCGGHASDLSPFRCMKKQGREIKDLYLRTRVGLFRATDDGWELLDNYIEDMIEAAQVAERRAA